MKAQIIAINPHTNAQANREIISSCVFCFSFIGSSSHTFTNLESADSINSSKIFFTSEISLFVNSIACFRSAISVLVLLGDILLIDCYTIVTKIKKIHDFYVSFHNIGILERVKIFLEKSEEIRVRASECDHCKCSRCCKRMDSLSSTCCYRTSC